MSLVNPYLLLGVDCKSKREEVRKIFKKLALICHPDKGGDEEQMNVLNLAYKYVIEQIEYGGHGRTMEEEEELFKKFLEEQSGEGIPSIFEIMTDESNKKFNEMWDNKKGDVYEMCYPSNYAEKMEKEPVKFSSELIEYKEPKTIGDISFSSVMDFTVNPVKDFSDYSGGVGFDYVLAHSWDQKDSEFIEKDTMSEYQKLLEKRKEEDEGLEGKFTKIEIGL